MSLLIKALKQAEKRHQAAQREADAAMAGRDEPIDEAALLAAAPPVQSPRTGADAATLALDPIIEPSTDVASDSNQSEHLHSSEVSVQDVSADAGLLVMAAHPTPLPAVEGGDSIDAQLAANAVSPEVGEAATRSVLLGVLPARVSAPESSPTGRTDPGSSASAAEPPVEVRFDPLTSAPAATAPATRAAGRFKPSSRMIVAGVLALAACGVGAWFTAALTGVDLGSFGGSTHPVASVPPAGTPMLPPLPIGDSESVSARSQSSVPASSTAAAMSPVQAGGAAASKSADPAPGAATTTSIPAAPTPTGAAVRITTKMTTALRRAPLTRR